MSTEQCEQCGSGRGTPSGTIWFQCDLMCGTMLYYPNRGERIIRYSNIIRILEAEYLYSYSYSGDFLKPNIIRIRIRVIFSNRILFVFVFG